MDEVMMVASIVVMAAGALLLMVFTPLPRWACFLIGAPGGIVVFWSLLFTVLRIRKKRRASWFPEPRIHSRSSGATTRLPPLADPLLHMSLVELFTVQDAILLRGHKTSGPLLLQPTFPVPQGWRRSALDLVSVVIVRPDGQQMEAAARIGLVNPHLYQRQPAVPADVEKRITVCFSDLSEADVPVGSKLLVPQELRDAIHPNHPA